MKKGVKTKDSKQITISLKTLGILSAILILAAAGFLVLTNLDGISGFTIFEPRYDWEKARVDTFIDDDITPYKSLAPLGYGTGEEFSNLVSAKMATVSEEGSSFEDAFELIFEYPDVESASNGFDKEIYDLLFGKSNESGMTVYSIELNGDKGYKSVKKDNIIYVWQRNRFVFVVGGEDEPKINKIMEFIVNEYSGDSEINIKTLSTLIKTFCGDHKCQYNENCDDCVEDCGCGYGKACGEKWEDYYECIADIGFSCDWDSDCASNHCVNGKCRETATYCGDRVCDYGEDCNDCPLDCGCDYDETCTTWGECKVRSGYACNWDSDCASSWCNNNLCN